MEKAKNKTLIDRIWDLFASIKLAIVIFATLALTSIIGTVIEQNAEPAKNIKLLTKLFGQSAAPSLFKVFDSLGFMDMYHSWWFVAILVFFAANLIICSIDRLPRIMKAVREPIKPLPEEHFKGFGIKKEIVLKDRPEKTREEVSDAVRRIMGSKPFEVKEENGFQLYAHTGKYTRLGVYVTHFSILIILIGAVAGIFFGFKGMLNLPEGETSSVAYLRGNQERSLGFGIRCDDFNVDFYGDTDMPKKYWSKLTIVKDGKDIMTKVITVNDPLTYEGVTFYQASYGLIPPGQAAPVVKLKVTSSDGKTENFDLKFGDTFTIPGTSLTGRVEDFSPALAFDEKSGKPFTYAEHMNNPAVLISFFENGAPKYRGWILKRHAETGRLPEGHILEFVDLWGAQYTGLQVRKDPGVWVVYFGCIAMAFGLFMAFFMSHRRIWVRLVEERNSTRVIVGASANKNKQAFETKVNKLISLLTQDKQGGK